MSLRQHSIILDWRPFSFERHEYLKVPYQDNLFIILVKTGGQGCPRESGEPVFETLDTRLRGYDEPDRIPARSCWTIRPRV